MIYRPSQETGLSDSVGQGGGGVDVLPDSMEGEGHHHITTPPHPFEFSNFPTGLRDIVQKNAG